MKRYIFFGGLFGGLGVIIGAFGAHSVKKLLPAQTFDVFQTAVQYQFIHSLALVFVGILSLQADDSKKTWLRVSGDFFLAGIVLFCGSLYALTLDGPRFFGPITPLGGLSFMIGWFTLALAYLKK